MQVIYIVILLLIVVILLSVICAFFEAVDDMKNDKLQQSLIDKDGNHIYYDRKLIAELEITQKPKGRKM